MDDLRAGLAPGFDPDAPLRRAAEPWDYLPMPALRNGPPWAMTEMIAAEPALARRIVARLSADGSGTALASAVRAALEEGSPVIVTGCGTSEHAAQGVAAILRDAARAAGIDGRWPLPAQAFELALDPPSAGLVIGVSHEGGTAATTAALTAAREAGARTALITASAGSPAAAAADLVLATEELDASWCHTVGYTSPLVAAAAAGAALAGDGAIDEAELGAALERRLAMGIEAAARQSEGIAERLAHAVTLLAVGSGVDAVSARELVLKVEEASWLPSAMRELETFLHGHLPATGESTALVLILTDPAAREPRLRRAIQALRAASAVGIRSAGILDGAAAREIEETLTPAGRLVVPAAPDLRGPVSALLGAATPLQLLTERLARARGTNPDPIRRDDPRYLAAAEAADAV